MTKQEQIKLDKIAKNDHEIYALIKQRYSPRIFADVEVTQNDMNRLFEAVRWSASSNNWQPWRFIYAYKGAAEYTRIADCLSDFNQSWATNAPVLILTAYKEQNPDGKENFHALHDLGLGLGNMAIQAEYMGIALHHMAGVDWKKAQETFNVPQGFHITTAIAVGYYGGNLKDLSENLQEQETAARKRIAQEEFAFKDSWASN